MDLFATKSDTEREDEEADRLVRPAPKLKPPRHDKRREHIQPDADPDQDETKDDRDLPLNYKDVGASERVVRRFLGEDTIVVKNKKLDDVVWVRPETLKEEPGKYQKVPPDEPEHQEGKPRPPAKPAKPAKPHRHKDPLPHPEWRERRPLPESPLKPVKPPKPVKRIPPFPVPEPEKEPPEKEPGWVPHTRTPSGRYASMGRVLARYLEAKGPPSKFIKVKHKDTGRTVRVTEETLKKAPSAYEKITEEQEEATFQEAREKLEALAQESPGLKRVLDDLKKKGPAYQEATQSPDTGIGHYTFWHELHNEGKWPKDIDTIGDLVGIVEAAPKLKKDEAFYGDAHRQLREQAKGDPNLAEILRQTKPGGVWDGFAQHNPDFPLKDVFKDRKFPPGVETMGDLVQLARAKPAKKPKPEAPKEAPKEEVAPPKAEEKPPATKPSPEAPPAGKPSLRRPSVGEEEAKSKAAPEMPPAPAPEPKKAPGGTQESEQVEPAKPEPPPEAPAKAEEPVAPAAAPKTEVMPAAPEAPAAPAEAPAAPEAPATAAPSGTQVMPAVPAKTDTGTQMMPAVEEPAKDEKPTKPEEPKTKLKPEQKKELDDWTKGGGVDAEDFRAFVDKDRTTKRDKSGKPLFRQKGGPAVPFEKLPEEAQLAWKQRFDQAQRHDKSVAALKGITDPAVQQVLKELADPNSERSKELKAQGDLTLLDPAKAIPELAGVELPESVDSLHDVVEAAKEVHKKPPEPKRRTVPEAERMEILRSAIRDLPRGSLATMARMHPDDIKQVVAQYTAAKSAIPGDIAPSKLVAAMGGSYTTDPSKVEPPAKAKDAKGREKPWDELSPKDQAEAMAAHRNAVVARSLAAKAHLADKFQRVVKAPPHLADTLAEFALNQGQGSGADRQRRAIEQSERMFTDALADEPLRAELSSKDVKKILAGLGKDPASQLLATSYFQARDYQAARKKYLDKDSPDAITEFQPPREIVRRMEKAVNYLRGQSSRYPEGTQTIDPASVFRRRVLDKLKTLNPEAAAQVEESVRATAGAEYETASKKWTKRQNKVTTGLSKVKAKTEALDKAESDQRQSAKDEYEKELDEIARKNVCEGPVGGPYRCPTPKANAEMTRAQEKAKAKHDAIQKKIQTWRAKKDKALKKDEDDLSAEQELLTKTAPKPPEGYTPAESKEKPVPTGAEDIWEGAFAKTACSRVAIRYAFSTCTEDRTMDKSSHARKAVYWGVPLDREGITPYPDWSQVHQRDLSEAMLGGILKAARDWLKTPILSTAVEGIVPDTQFRAALDLAIRTHEGGRYSVGLHPAVYNDLLARLAGSPTTGTLVTVQAKEANYGSVYASAGERTMKPSAHIRAYAVRIATTHPDIAFDLTELSHKVAQEEKGQDPEAEGQQKQAKDAEDKDDPKDDPKVGQDKPKQGQGQPEQQKKEAKDAEDKEDPKMGQDGDKEGQDDKPFPGAAKPFEKKEAYLALRSACIRTAASNPAAKAALMPVLQLIRKLG